MKSKASSFLYGFSIYSIIIAAISLVIDLWVPSIEISYVWYAILAFLYLFTMFAYVLLVKYIESRISYFANAFMLVNFGKLVLFTLIIVIYAWLNRSDAISFTVTFFIYYLLLTIYEIISLLKMQKKAAK